MDEIATKQQWSDCFKLLSACFYEPEKKFLEGEDVCLHLQRLLALLCIEGEQPAQQMATALQSSTEEELQIAHAQLFIGPFALKASPYGSTYLEKTGTVMGDSTMEVMHHYQDAGLMVDVQEPPDHIAIELEFLSFLCALEGEALHDGDMAKAAELQTKQQLFLANFVLPWMPGFIKNIRAATENGFYLGLADCCEKTMEQLSLFTMPTYLDEREAMLGHVDAATP